MRKIKYLLVMLFVSFISLTNAKGLYDNYDYYIDDYNVVIDVNKDNSFDITEEIRVYFNQARHGIYRSIPLRNRVSRLDGTTTNNYVNISNVYTNVFSTQSKSDGNLVIRLGDANNLVTGYQEYVIKYNYNIGKDSLKDKDEFYFNIIGPEWETVITNVTFTINMPDAFDSGLLGFSSGFVGSTTNNVIYEVSGNTIRGSLNTPLYEGDALTVRLELPEGYFSEAKSVIGNTITWSFLLPLSCLLLVFVISYIKCFGRKIVAPVEFYPPKGYNSLELAFLYKGETENKDVVSLLVYLANKGYIKIIERETQNLFTKDTNTLIVKLKDYDGDKKDELEFMQGLFKSGDEVNVDFLKNNFYSTLNIIRNDINSKENKEKIIHKSNRSYKFLFGIIAVVCFMGTLILQVIDFAPSEAILMMFFFAAFYSVILSMFFASKNSIVIYIFACAMVGIQGFIIFASMFGEYFITPLQIINIVIAVIASGIIVFIITKFIYRTDFGNEIYGQIQGFKKFLEVAEKEQLEQLVSKNPEYFYDILPYVYVLGITDKWISKFESIAIEPVRWYEGYNTFNVVVFNSSMNSVMNSMKTGYSGTGGSGFSFDSSSSGGSSGGGSSGGGSGGGGGGSW